MLSPVGRKICAKFAFFVISYFAVTAASESNPLIFSTNECTLTEPIYGHKFDFSALHSELAHHAISDKNDVFEFNICGNLTRSCDGQQNAAACLKKGNKEYVLGRQHELHYRNGKIFFKFLNGSRCPHGNGEFMLHVGLSCDYTLDKTQAHVTAYADDACSYYITYETPLACLPVPDAVKSNNCTVHDENTGYTFDLMPLSDVNYRTTDRKGSIFVINVCKPVLYGENAMCPPGSSICYLSSKAVDPKRRFFNYGTVQPKPVIENGHLLMRHISPTPCNGTLNYTSIVYFFCEKFIKNVHPEYLGEHECTYEFSFTTPLACSDLKPCAAVTHGNEILDLSSLSHAAPFVLNKDNKNYTFAVCADAGEPCMGKNGACVTENSQTTSLGNTNSYLRFNQSGSPYLLYDGGAPCTKSSGNTFWSTKIEFVCANNATKDSMAGAGTGSSLQMSFQPKIIEDSNCQLLIQYQTALACQEQITCKAKAFVGYGEEDTGEEIVDLTPLISATENYEAKIDLPANVAQQVPKTTKFFLNVCRPLVPKYQLGCAGGSAACMAKVVASGSPEEEHSLGFPQTSLVAINGTAAELRYYSGDPCPTDKTTQLSSRIEFYCDMSAGRGTPVLRTIEDCHYGFVWRTSVICPPHECIYQHETCDILQNDLGLKYNLKTAPYTKDGKVEIDLNQTIFTLNLCGAHRKAITDYSQDLVNIFFTQKGPCGVNGIVNVQMRLICSNETERLNFFSDDKQCNLLYVQRTPDICKFLGLAVPTTPTVPSTPTNKPSTSTEAPHTGSSTESSKDAPNENLPSGSIGTILAAILSLTCFVVCFGILAFSPERRQSLRRLFRRGTSAVRYSRVRSNEEANLLLEQNGEFTESDDDMLL